MNSQRLEQLLKMLEESPDDPFLLYAIGMEYISTDTESARTYFKELEKKYPDYLPLYFTYASFLYENEQYEEALKKADKGIALAEETAQDKALSELKQLKMNIEFEL